MQDHSLKTITVIGAGLAGTEASWQLAQAIEKYHLPYKVKLYEMRPKVKTPAHHTDNLAELVCSNSLGSEFLTTARGLLINEMQKFDSLIINSAIKAKVPAGQALAVDRDLFAKEITDALTNNPHVEIIRDEFAEDILDHLQKSEYIILASGPLTSPGLATRIQELLSKVSGTENKKNFLYFFDAASPIVASESINMDIAFKASRYGKGETDDYINCPFYNQEDFDNFYQALMSAERAPLKDFEKESIKYFEGCMPIEAIAERGQKTLTFGPLKPVGLRDPRDPERRAVAVVQLRQDNVIGSLYNIVGFQTNLKWGEQKRVFSMIPGLENLEIVRYGVMHQNIFINSPEFLNENLNLKHHCKEGDLSCGALAKQEALRNTEDLSRIYFAGQITGVEGYTESAATGIVAARSIIGKILNIAFELPKHTMMRALVHYISHAEAKHFQPINSNWGLLNDDPEALDKSLKKNKALRHEFFVNRSLDTFKELILN